VVEAYSQLAAEGYLVLRQGARPKISEAARPREDASSLSAAQAAVPRFDFRPRPPDVSSFPRAAWLRSLREAVGEIADAELLYGDPGGVEALRAALAEYLGRVRGVVADPGRVVVTCGYPQG
jgi:GntR family transcriptional regulator/MocR family aminotransferase